MSTLLVVDDEFLVADVLAFALEDEGYQVLRASNGLRALEQFDRGPIALVVTDYMMPAMNGLELAEALRSRMGSAAPPIILMSGAQAHLARQQGDLFLAGFDKPFRVSEIVAAIQAAVPPPA